MADKKWSITVKTVGESISMQRVNDGFNAYELLGFLEQCRNDILKQIEGAVKVDVVKRSVIKPKKN